MRSSVAAIVSAAAARTRSEPMSATTVGNRSSPWRARSAVAHLGQALLAAADEHDSRSELRQLLGRLATQARRRPGYHHGLPDECAGVGGGQPYSARRVRIPMFEKLPITVTSSTSSIRSRTQPS